MGERIRKLYNNHSEIISYIFFGALTTAVNFVIFFPLYNYLHYTAAFSNVIAWLGAVIFAFLVNKRFVFRDLDWSIAALLKQTIMFLGCRILSGFAETALLFLTVDWLRFDGNVWKIIISIVVIVLNYLGSKMLVFKKQ